MESDDPALQSDPRNVGENRPFNPPPSRCIRCIAPIISSFSIDEIERLDAATMWVFLIRKTWQYQFFVKSLKSIAEELPDDQRDNIIEEGIDKARRQSGGCKSGWGPGDLVHWLKLLASRNSRCNFAQFAFLDFIRKPTNPLCISISEEPRTEEGLKFLGLLKDPGDTPEALLLLEEQKRSLNAAIENLSDEKQRRIRLWLSEDLAYGAGAKVAKKLEITPEAFRGVPVAHLEKNSLMFCRVMDSSSSAVWLFRIDSGTGLNAQLLGFLQTESHFVVPDYAKSISVVKLSGI